MAQVGIVMGSDSDLAVMKQAAEILEQFGISYDMTILSAHREVDEFFTYAKSAEEKGYKVIIAGAGMAAHLPGMCAAIFPLPVIGVPMHTTSLGGRDSLYSIVQMPSGIPVATVAINGGKNAGILAAKMLAMSDPQLLQKIKDYKESLKEEVKAKTSGSWLSKLQQITKQGMRREKMDYKKAGVDIEAGYRSVELMKDYVKETMRPEVLGGLGGFSGAFSLKAIKDMEIKLHIINILNSSPSWPFSFYFPMQNLSKEFKNRAFSIC